MEDSDAFELIKLEALDLQDAIAWDHVKPKWKTTAARWTKVVKRQRLPIDSFKLMELWKCIKELETMVLQSNMLERAH